MRNTETVYWFGSKPTVCQICNARLIEVFYDANTSRGWGILCWTCFATYGKGCGTGLGQRYEKINNVWQKTEG